MDRYLLAWRDPVLDDHRRQAASGTFLGAVDWALAPDPAARPQDLQAFSQKLYASHAGSLALHDALRAGESVPGFGNESLRALLVSPRLLKRRALQFWRAMLHPASWPKVGLQQSPRISMPLATLA